MRVGRRAFLGLLGAAVAAPAVAEAAKPVQQVAAFVPSERLMRHAPQRPAPIGYGYLYDPKTLTVRPASPGPYYIKPDGLYSPYDDLMYGPEWYPEKPEPFVAREIPLSTKEDPLGQRGFTAAELEEALGESMGQRLHEAMIEAMQGPMQPYPIDARIYGSPGTVLPILRPRPHARITGTYIWTADEDDR